MPNQTLNVHIISPQGVLYDGPALAVSSTNSFGKFDILPQHANFITIVENVPIIVKTDKKQTLDFNFPLAIIYNSGDSVHIYTGITPQI